VSFSTSSSSPAIETSGIIGYLSVLGLTAGSIFLVLWLLIAAVPLAVLDHEYPIWEAKKHIIDICDSGDLLILGDSRAAVGIIPDRLPVKAVNAAFAGGNIIEAYYAAERAMQCPHPPSRVVVAVSVSRWNDADQFWNRTVRLSLLSLHQLGEVRATAEKIHDSLLARARDETGLPAGLRGWAAATRFPPAYFNSVANSGIGYRYIRNRAVEAAVLAARGYYPIVRDPGHSPVGAEAGMTGFRPAPLLDAYLDRILALLAAHHAEALFVVMPVSESTYDRTPPEVWRAFASYVAKAGARYPVLRLEGPVPPHWADGYFGDSGQHLTKAGALLYTQWLSDCLAHAVPDPNRF
jgi:hypothetical protein